MKLIDYPIIGWASLSESLTRPDVFANIWRAGINVFMTAGAQGADDGNVSLIRLQLDLAREAGLQALVCDRRFRPGAGESNLLAAIDEYVSHDAVFGFFVRD